MSNDEPQSETPPVAEAEASGETVGEAKWTALRQLEQRYPGLDKAQVEFVVISEGERGLLGVGFVPARVLAKVSGPIRPAEKPRAHEPRPAAQPAGPLSPAAERLKDVLEHIRDALGLDASVSVREDGAGVTGVFHGHELGLVIGKHGQTIDAIQYLAVSAVHRMSDGSQLDVVVDASGYRDRRRATLEGQADRAADRAASSGSAVELDPMSAPERKIVHLHLHDREDVTTSSEGAEPHRCVVVRPAP
jgi:spoIIIJ-associated protein